MKKRKSKQNVREVQVGAGMVATIERGVPLPPPVVSWVAVASHIEPGESMFVKSEIQRDRLGNALRRLFGPESVTSRRVKDGYRVWRVK